MRHLVIEGKFKSSILNAMFPTMIDNEQEWKKFYDRHHEQEQAKKSLKNYRKYSTSRSNGTLEILRGSYAGCGAESGVVIGGLRRKSVLNKKGINFVHCSVRA